MATDIELVRKHFPVEVLTYEGKRLGMAWQVLRRLLQGQVGAIVFWFAVPSFGFGISIIAKLVRCPIVLITGGYDVANMPEIGFGSMILAQAQAAGNRNAQDGEHDTNLLKLCAD